MVASPAGRSCQLARQCGAGRDCGLGVLQREREVTTAALKARCCSAPGGGVDFAITIDLTEQQLGRCPKPHKGRCPLTLQETLSLEPFARLSWFRYPYFFRVLLFLFAAKEVRKRKRPCRCPIHLKQRLILPCASTEPCTRVLRVIPTGIAACPARPELFPQLALLFPAIARHRNPRRFPVADAECACLHRRFDRLAEIRRLTVAGNILLHVAPLIRDAVWVCIEVIRRKRIGCFSDEHIFAEILAHIRHQF